MSSPTAVVTEPHKIIIQRTALGRFFHRLFSASLVIKGVLAASEALSGAGLLLTPNHKILAFVAWLTRHELTQDPQDEMALWFRHMAEAFPIQTQHFYALYLLGHGTLKLIMVLLLARRVMWAYPASMVVLAGFVVYEFHDFLLTRSLPLLALCLLDAIMIGLVWREWRELRRARGVAPPTRPA